MGGDCVDERNICGKCASRWEFSNISTKFERIFFVVRNQGQTRIYLYVLNIFKSGAKSGDPALFGS